MIIWTEIMKDTELPETESLASDGYELIVGYLSKNNHGEITCENDHESLFSITHFSELNTPETL